MASNFALLSVAGASVGIGSLAIGIGSLVFKKFPTAAADKGVIIWLFYDAVIHFVLVT